MRTITSLFCRGFYVGPIALIASVLIGLSVPQAAFCQAAAPLAIGQTLQGLTQVVQQLEDSSRALMSQGNASLAQQQMLLAGTLQGLIDRATTAYAGSLNLTFNQVGVAEANAANDIMSVVDQLNTLEKGTSGDMQAAIYKVQGAANQLLNRLPLTTKVPVYYGVSVRDLFTNPTFNPADIEVLGFLFRDSRLNFKPPIVTVAGIAIAPKFISVQDDRIEIQIPEAVKQKIGFGFTPCSPRPTFPIAIRVFYEKSAGFWPITWNREASVDFNANALPAAQTYDVQVNFSGIRVNKALKLQQYSNRSGSVSVGCEESNSTSVAFNAPPDAQEMSCSAGWADTRSLKAESHSCGVTGTTASASGTITGLDRNCYIVGDVIGMIAGHKNVCDCPGGGHGSLEVSGSYKVPQNQTEKLSDVSVGKYRMPEDRNVYVTLPSDSSLSKTKVTAIVQRHLCAAVYDSVTLNVNENKNLGVQQDSLNGHLHVTYRDDQLTFFPSK